MALATSLLVAHPAVAHQVPAAPGAPAPDKAVAGVARDHPIAAVSVHVDSELATTTPAVTLGDAGESNSLSRADYISFLRNAKSEMVMKAATLLMTSLMPQATSAARGTPRSAFHPARRATTRTTQRLALRIVSGVEENGRASPLWLAMIRKRLTPAEYDSAASIVKPFTPAESAWAALIQSRQGAWTSMAPALVAIYEPMAPPTVVTVALGNRAASDAFTHDSITIGFDLAEMQANYGNASLPTSTDLIDRLFRHEFMHVMQKPWLKAHPWPTNTPLERALLDVWAEGLGNYQSLSSRWTTSNGQRPALSAKTLMELEPRFVARLAALACATPQNAEPLLHDLSSGPFAKKWGAVTPALWLESETAQSKDALRQFVLAGPAGVWALANRHLPETLRPVLREAQTAGVMCGQRTGNTKAR